jgi:glyoxylase-like metal-dependent hydrolase (beta-lactamase superfamily II)
MSIGDDGIVLIDAMNTDTGSTLIKAIRTISDKPIKYVINTHQHADHRGGNEAMIAMGATIIYPDYLKHTPYPGVNQEIQFKDKMTLRANGEVFTLYHVKSHTWNDVIVHMQHNNAVFTGDNHATNWGPNIGIRGYQGHREIFDLVIGLSDQKTLVVPGHMALANLVQFKQFDLKTQEWFEHILSLHHQGITPETIVKHKKTTALLSWFHGGEIPQWLNPDSQLSRVEGTIFSDETSVIKMSADELQKYVGRYQLTDGSIVKIFSDNLGIYAYKESTFMVHLLPKGPSHFDFNGWAEQEQLNFEWNEQGKVKKLSYQVNDQEQFIALKMTD